MAIFDRENQRGRRLAIAVFGAHGFVHVGACFDQSSHNFGSPFTYGEEQRRETGLEWRTEVGPLFEQRVDNFRVSVGRGPHERGLLPSLASIEVGALRE